MLSLAELQRVSAESGFRPEILEKALRLLDLLNGLRAHPFAGQRVALKGGSALNLFVLDVPRLSVDIDLDYVGAADRAVMLADRARLEQAIAAVCSRSGVTVRHVPRQHAGGKWRLSYASATGRTGTMELDLNYLLRTPLAAPRVIDSRLVGSFRATGVLVHDPSELVAGKLAALFGRRASRDLFDAVGLLRMVRRDDPRLRIGFVVYGAMSRRDWRTVSLEDVRIDPADADRQLLPMLRRDLAPDRSRLQAWCDDLAGTCRELLVDLLPLRTNEVEFLTRLNDVKQPSGQSGDRNHRRSSSAPATVTVTGRRSWLPSSRVSSAT